MNKLFWQDFSRIFVPPSKYYPFFTMGDRPRLPSKSQKNPREKVYSYRNTWQKVYLKYLRCTFPRVVDVTDYATVTNRAAQAGTAATGVFSFDLEYFTDASFSMVSTDDDDKIVGETIFFQIVPSDSPGNVPQTTITEHNRVERFASLLFRTLV